MTYIENTDEYKSAPTRSTKQWTTTEKPNLFHKLFWQKPKIQMIFKVNKDIIHPFDYWVFEIEAAATIFHAVFLVKILSNLVLMTVWKKFKDLKTYKY